MSLKNFTQIENGYIEKNGVQALADRPNAVSIYGLGGMDPKKLKEHFDKVSTELIRRLNELYSLLEGRKDPNDSTTDYITDYIKLPETFESPKSLTDLIKMIKSGDFSKILNAYEGDTLKTLQVIIENIWNTLNGFRLNVTVDGNTLLLELQNELDASCGDAREIDLSVKTDRISNCAVTTEKLDDAAVTTQKIKDEAITTEKLAGCINEKINKAFTGCNVSYVPESAIFKLTFFNNAGEPIVREIDANIQAAIINIDDYIAEDGTLHLRLSLANGDTKDICMDEVFEGFVKHFEGQYKIYGTDANGDDTSYDIDTSSAPCVEGSIVRRAEDGNLIVPGIDTTTDYAAPLGYLGRIIAQVNEELDGVLAIQNQYIGGST